MTHLADEQLEALVLGEDCERGVSEHASQCPRCALRLAERRAIRTRVQRAVASVAPPAGLAERMRAVVQARRRGEELPAAEATGSSRPETEAAPAPAPAAPAPAAPTKRRLRLRPWWGLSAAAAVLLVVGGWFVVGRPAPAFAARARLGQIYQECLCLCQLARDDERTFRSSDPDKVARFLSRRVGHTPVLPRIADDVVLRGGRIVRFRDADVPAYVLEVGGKAVAVVVISLTPREMELSHRYEHAGREFWRCMAGRCTLAAVRLGDKTYCVVGQVGAEQLKRISHDLADHSPVKPPAWTEAS